MSSTSLSRPSTDTFQKDLIGSLLLATAFVSLYGIRDPNAYTPPVVDTATHSLIINPVTPSSIVSTQHILSSL